MQSHQNNSNQSLDEEAFFEAIEKNDIKTVKQLLNRGVNVNTTDCYGQTPLIHAAQLNHLDIAKWLIARGADINQADNDGDTPLIKAADLGHLDIAKWLIAKGADIHKANNDGDTPLHHVYGNGYSYTAKSGHLGIAKLLIERKADINKTNNNGETILHKAVYYDRVELTKLLIDRKADINKANNNGDTPLHVVGAYVGHVEIARLLIEKKADINKTNNNGDTPLYNAIYHGYAEIARLLIKGGASADINKKDNSGSTLLHKAAEHGELDIVKFLIGIGADVDKTDDAGSTPLHKAVWSDKLDIVKFLIGKGADVNKTDASGSAPLHKANSEEVANYLIEKGADIDKVNRSGKTPLSEALYIPNPEYVVASNDVDARNLSHVALFLIERGADINKGWCTPLHAVCGVNHARLLIERGADINKIDIDGNTPLMRACEYDNTYDSWGNSLSMIDGESITTLLIASGADVNKANKEGNTALHRALYCGAIDNARLLIKMGADIHKANNNSDTPLHYAAWADELDIVKLLIKANAGIRKVNNNGDTLLHHAASEAPPGCWRSSWDDRFNIVKLLIETGLDIHRANNNGETPLHKASKSERSDIVKLFIETGADINKADNDGNTPLHAGIKNIDVVRLLIERGANIHIVNNNGDTPLHKASERIQNIDVFRLLIERGADIHKTNNDGDTSFHKAAVNINFDAASLLLEKGADVNKTNNNGDTPLHCAILIPNTDSNRLPDRLPSYYFCLSAVKFLIKNGANLQAVNKDGKTPYDIAIENHKYEIADYLLTSKLETEAVDDSIKSPNVRIEELAKENDQLNQQIEKYQKQEAQLKYKIEAAKDHGASRVDVETLEKQLREVIEQQTPLVIEHRTKIAKQNALQALKTQPNAWEFYHTFYNRLEAVLIIGAKAASSEFCVIDSSRSDLNMAKNVFTAVGKVLSLLPVIGNTLNSVVGGIGKGLDEVGLIRLKNSLMFMSDLGTLKELQKVIEQCAMQLTHRYMEQISNLKTREEVEAEKRAPQHSPLWEKVKLSVQDAAQNVKSVVLKDRAMSDVEQLALFAVMQIVSALLDGDIKKDESLVEQFLKPLTKAPSKAQKIRKVVIDTLGMDKVITKDKKPWQLSDIFSKPGIRTQDGTLYAGDDAYGYREGTDDEANARGLRLQKKQPQPKQSQAQYVQPAVNVALVKPLKQEELEETSSTDSKLNTLEQQMLSMREELNNTKSKSNDDSSILVKFEHKLHEVEGELRRLKTQVVPEPESAISVDSGSNQAVLFAEKNKLLDASASAHARSLQQEHMLQMSNRIVALEEQLAEALDDIRNILRTQSSVPVKVKRSATSTVQVDVQPTMPLIDRKKKAQGIFRQKLVEAKTISEVYNLYQVLISPQYKFLQQEAGLFFNTLKNHGPDFLQSTTNYTNTWCQIVINFKIRSLELLKNQKTITTTDYDCCLEIFRAKSKRVGEEDDYLKEFRRLQLSIVEVKDTKSAYNGMGFDI